MGQGKGYDQFTLNGDHATAGLFLRFLPPVGPLPVITIIIIDLHYNNYHSYFEDMNGLYTPSIYH